MKLETRLRMTIQEMNDAVCDRTENPTEYMMVITSMLGIAVAAMAHNKDEIIFDKMLVHAFEMVEVMAVGHRQVLKADGGEWVSVH